MLQKLSLLAALSLLGGPAVAQLTPCHADFASANYLTNWSMGGPGLTLAIKLQSPSVLAITRLEVHTGGRSGTSKMHVFSHDATNNQPLAELGASPFQESSSIGWQGAYFSPPVVILPNQDFWFGWTPLGGELTPTEGHGTNPPPAGAQPYRATFNGGGSWNGPFVQHQWKLRIWCVGSTPGSIVTFGTGCRGSNGLVPLLGATGTPTLGQTYTVGLTQALALQPAFLGLGVSTQTWGSVTLPLNLGAFGAPTCNLLIDLPATIAVSTDASGTASVPLLVPNLPNLAAQAVHHQWIVFDFPANNLHAVLSQGATAVVGN